jgi:SAM-dependent methyltransferase
MTIGRLARWYRWIEYAAFGRALERRRFAFLDRLAGARRILILGEGDGRVLARLLAIAPQAQFDVVEVSPEMIALARGRTGNSERVRFLCQDARTFAFPASYDAVLTMFFLDCFTEQDARHLTLRLAESLKAGGRWLISEFAIPEKGWSRPLAGLWIWAMYRFFRVTTGLRPQKLPPVEQLVAQAGMMGSDREEERGGMLYSAVFTMRE